MSNTSDGRDLGLREVKVALDRAVRELRVCGEGIRWSSATILQSCNTPGTKSMAHRNMLADKAKSLENVAALCSMMAGRLTEYGQKLVLCPS